MVTIRIIPTWKEKYLSTGEKSSFACTTTTKPAKAKKLKLHLCSEAFVYIRHCTSVHIKSEWLDCTWDLESVRILKNQPKVVGTRCRKLVL